jgi:hypothetical protein
MRAFFRTNLAFRQQAYRLPQKRCSPSFTCAKSELPYGEAFRTIQIDTIAYCEATRCLGAYEVKAPLVGLTRAKFVKRSRIFFASTFS